MFLFSYTRKRINRENLSEGVFLFCSLRTLTNEKGGLFTRSFSRRNREKKKLDEFRRNFRIRKYGEISKGFHKNVGVS